MGNLLKNTFSISFLLTGLTWASMWMVIGNSDDFTSWSPFVLSGLVAISICVLGAHFLQNWTSQLRNFDGEVDPSKAELLEKLKEMQRKIEHDGLTSVLNREAFFKEVEGAQRDSSEGVLLMIDADNFKSINDTFGHAAGDRALRMIADLIAINIRGHDFVGRVGGEEFAVFLANADRNTSTIVAERIRAAVADFEFWPTDRQRHNLSISVGGAYLSNLDSIQKVLNEADSRMYEAKRMGKNCCVLPFVRTVRQDGQEFVERRAA